MNQTILLGLNNNFSIKANRRLAIFLGLIFCLNGFFNLIQNNEDLLFQILGLLLLLSGVLYLFYSFYGFSQKSKFAPKVLLTNEFLQIRESFWKPAKQLNWNNISSINYLSYQIDFQLNKESYSFIYNASSDTSIEIKRAIREFAENKGIEVIGG